MWDFWWTKWHWGRFSQSTSISPANLHSADFSTITIAHHPGLVQYTSSGRSTQSPTAQIKKKVSIDRIAAVNTIPLPSNMNRGK
jgi:hypothetical protein